MPDSDKMQLGLGTDPPYTKGKTTNRTKALDGATDINMMPGGNRYGFSSEDCPNTQYETMG